MGYSRRKFLRSLFQGGGVIVAATLIPNKLQAALDEPGFGLVELDQVSKEEVQALYRQAKELFLRKQYASATITYQRLTTLQPKAIEAYDGLAKVYKAQNLHAQVAVLFKDALKKNEKNVLFYDRYAHALTSLCLGNREQQQQYLELYNEKDNLLEVAAQEYKKAITLAPDKQYLQLELLDLRGKLSAKNKALEKFGEPTWTFSETMSTYMAGIESNIGQKWVTTRKPLSKNIAENPEEIIQKMNDKKRRPLHSEQEQQQREEHIKLQKTRVYYPLLAQAFKERRMQDVEKFSQAILDVNPLSTSALAKLRVLYKNNKQYDKLVALYENRSGIGSELWSQVALANAILRRANQSGKVDADRISGIVQTMREQDLESNKLIAATCWINANTLKRQKQYKQGRQDIIKTLEQLPVDSDLSTSLRLTYSDTYNQESKSEQALLILQAMTDDDMSEQQLQGEPLKSNLTELWRVRRQSKEEVSSVGQPSSDKKRTSKKGVGLDAYYKIAQLQKRQGNQQGWSKTLEKIKAIAPNSKFVAKAMKVA